jgi:hypothetical protein
LVQNTSGDDNTAIGLGALGENTTGSYNTASGAVALADNTTGYYNTASGYAALENNTIGYFNTAIGYQALQANTASGEMAGSGNTAIGYQALLNNTIGGNNIGIGYQALYSNIDGTNNIAIGLEAASSVSGSPINNIHIGNIGASADTNVIRIGSAQTGGTYIAGIYGGTPGIPNYLVCVDFNGNLGSTGCSSAPSSRRFKEQIADMGDSSSKILQLRPVTFLYKPQYDDGSHALQYGLIAEEVAEIYPEMVGYDKDGQISSVKYQLLAPMLLNEVQKQHAEAEKQKQRAQEQDETIRRLAARLSALEAVLGTVPVAATAGQ